MEPVQLHDRGTRNHLPASSDLAVARPAVAAGHEPAGLALDISGVVEALPEGALIIGVGDGTVWAANAEAERLFGRRPVVGLPIASLFDGARGGEAGAEEAGAVLLARAGGGETVREVDLTIARPDGAGLPVLATASPVRDARGQVVAVALTLRSISRAIPDEHLAHDYVVRLVHEARGALSAILGCVGLLENLAREPIRPRRTAGYVDPESHYLGTIKADAWQIHSMLGELLDVATIASGEVKLDRQHLDLVALVDDLVARLAPSAGTLATGHQITVRRRRLAPLVYADPARMEQIVASLILTAVRYSPPGTDITVVVEPGVDTVALSVSSSAGGIPRGELSRLFDQMLPRQYLRREHRGLGSSLYVARGLVTAHGGEIWAESRPGAGATFHVTLPILPTGQ